MVRVQITTSKEAEVLCKNITAVADRYLVNMNSDLSFRGRPLGDISEMAALKVVVDQKQVVICAKLEEMVTTF